MILLNLWLLFGFNVPCGVVEAKRMEDIYGEPPLLGIPRRYVVSIGTPASTFAFLPSAFFLLALWFRLSARSRLWLRVFSQGCW